MNKLISFLAICLIAIVCSSCQKNPNISEEPKPETTTSSLKTTIPKNDETYSTVLSVPDRKIKEKGKELLAKYQVSYEQTIRFPYEGYFYQSHGAYALTSIEEAREKYPEWVIPEKLGDYLFVDLTTYTCRTDVVFPEAVPPPKDTIEIITDEKPDQYYLCYKNASTRFWINVIPFFGDMDTMDKYDLISEFTSWSSYPEIYYQLSSESISTFDSLLILSKPNEEYAFFIHKISEEDCLDNTTVEITKDEALSIYNAIREDFH